MPTIEVNPDVVMQDATGFPATLWLVRFPDGRHLAQNYTTTGPDPMNANFIDTHDTE